MFIKYNKSNLHALGSFDGKEVRWLKPGWNEFPSHIWKLYETDKSILKMIEDKEIEFLDEKVKVKEGKKTVTKVLGSDDEPVSLKDLSEAKAIEVIKGTHDRAMLQRWTDEENRHKVKRELEKQLKPLLPEQAAN